MVCKNCGNEINNGDKFCNSCGTKVEIAVEETKKEEVVTTNTPKKSNGGLIALFIILGVLVLGGITFGVIVLLNLRGDTKEITPAVSIKTADKKETFTYEGYTFTIPEDYVVSNTTGTNIIGDNNFKFQLLGVDSLYSYSDYSNEKTIETVKNYIPESTAKFLKQTEETYGGKKFLIFSFEYGNSYSDAVITELFDNKVLMIMTLYSKEEAKKDGYTNLAKFVSSATKETTTDTKKDDTKTTDTTDTNKKYMVMGDDTLGYVKLPGSWYKGKVAGSADSSLQYFTYDNGKYIITLDVLDKTKYTDIKSTASTFEYSYKQDSDATNISTTQTKVGKYDAYQIKVQYKSDSVWVYSYFFKAEDGLIHMIQTEGLDTTSDYFDIPDTFSLTKIN